MQFLLLRLAHGTLYPIISTFEYDYIINANTFPAVDRDLRVLGDSRARKFDL